MVAALLMAAFKIAITPFLTAVGGGLGSHVADWMWSTVSAAGHADIADRMKAGAASAEQQRTAQQVAATAVQEPGKAQQLHAVAATNPIAQPLAQSYEGLLATQPQVWTEFATGSSTLTQLAESRAEVFDWSKEQLNYDLTGLCPIGGEQLPPFGSLRTSMSPERRCLLLGCSASRQFGLQMDEDSSHTELPLTAPMRITGRYTPPD